MNKNLKLFLAGMFGIVLAFGIVVMGCDNDPDENTDPKKIIITGLGEQSGSIEVSLYSTSFDNADVEGEETISDTSVTISLKVAEDGKDTDELDDWTGTGSYYLILEVGDNMYLYTNGKTFDDLGITGQQDIAKLPKIDISETTITIAFTEFVPVPREMMSGGGE
ncbi:MAG: hypothetical protein LBP76_06225 [Treponema sp.]|jgi:hypothetical protein|nr:hypothetical protein [Treponema sp.]